MCKLGMFSYRAGILQMGAAKRAENRFNGVTASSSGEGCIHPIGAMNILRWTLAPTSFIVESLREPSL
jgi:hypothetical protein